MVWLRVGYLGVSEGYGSASIGRDWLQCRLELSLMGP